jgi:hypothetical protein
MDSDKEKEHHGDATEGEEGVKQQRAHEGDLFNSKRWKKRLSSRVFRIRNI